MNNTDIPQLNWEDLLSRIKSNNVIPVIGRQLYRVDIDSGGKKNFPLYEYLSEVVSKEKHHKFPMACQKYLSENTNSRRKLSDFLKKQLQDICLTEENPLYKLARIKSFDLFVNTTCDNFLLKALKKVRTSSPHIFFYTTMQNNIDPKIPVNNDNLIFHIFGNLMVKENLYIAYTEGFMVDTIMSFFKNIKESPNHRLIRRMVDSALLFLGCEYDDWLLQYLMCLLSSNSYKNENFKLIMGDNFNNPSHDLFQQLIQFLIKQNVVEFYPVKDGNFVDLLFDEIQTEEIIQPEDFPGSVFISFEGRDRKEAQELTSALQDAGIGVWLDENNLRLGNEVKKEIIDAINKCTIFIPLTSKHTKTKVDKKKSQNIISRNGSTLIQNTSLIRKKLTLSRWY